MTRKQPENKVNPAPGLVYRLRGSMSTQTGTETFRVLPGGQQIVSGKGGHQNNTTNCNISRRYMRAASILDDAWGRLSDEQQDAWGRAGNDLGNNLWSGLDCYRHVNMGRAFIDLALAQWPPDPSGSTRTHITEPIETDVWTEVTPAPPHADEGVSGESIIEDLEAAGWTVCEQTDDMEGVPSDCGECSWPFLEIPAARQVNVILYGALAIATKLPPLIYVDTEKYGDYPPARYLDEGYPAVMRYAELVAEDISGDTRHITIEKVSDPPTRVAVRVQAPAEDAPYTAAEVTLAAIWPPRLTAIETGDCAEIDISIEHTPEYSTDLVLSRDGEDIRVFEPGSGEWTETAPAPDTSYTYGIRARCEYGATDSHTATITSRDWRPHTIDDLAASDITETSVTLTWRRPALSDPDAHTIRILVDGSLDGTVGRDATTYTVSGLTAGMTYQFGAEAANDCAIGPRSTVTATTTTSASCPCEDVDAETLQVTGMQESFWNSSSQPPCNPSLPLVADTIELSLDSNDGENCSWSYTPATAEGIGPNTSGDPLYKLASVTLANTSDTGYAITVQIIHAFWPGGPCSAGPNDHISSPAKDCPDIEGTYTDSSGNTVTVAIPE